MGYPRRIRVLVIEDEHQMVQAYHGYVDIMRKRYPVGQVHVAQGFDDAIAQLAGDAVFHMVILDLKIPERAGDESAESSFGVQLIAAVADRERWPVPVLLIFTGDPERLAKIPAIQREIGAKFWHAQIAPKSADLTGEIDLAFQKALAYTEVGFSVRDTPEALRPGITVIEEYLIRRAALDRKAESVDLVWWSAVPRGPAGWTKVLWGRFVDPDDGPGKPHFFKLEAADEGARSAESARRLGNKLPHLQVVAWLAAKSRSLLVTAKVGPSQDRPLSFDEILDQEAVDARAIARAIADQLARFELSAKLQVPRRSLLTSLPGLDRRACLETVVGRLGPGRSPVHPMVALERLTRDDLIWVRRRRSHGDLHTGNISFDREGPTLHAYVIDAGALNEDIDGRDLAALEVSILLHEDLPLDVAAALYDGSGRALPTDGLRPRERNAVQILAAIRAEALVDSDEATYAVLLLDAVLMQLGGLAFGSTGNRVRRPVDAMELFAQLAAWVGRIQQWPEITALA